MSPSHRTVPGLEADTARTVADTLASRLVATLDLQLTLKHVHWNVVCAGFLSVHEMLDEHVAPVRAMSDALAERVRTLGGTPLGTPGAVVAGRTWGDYAIGTAPVVEHLRQLDRVYDGVIADHRKAIAAVADLDPVSEDLLIAHTGQLEEFQWFVRSFLETSGADASPGFGQADRGPTADEARGAERAADEVDVDDVGSSYREMAEVGANVKGEGQI